MLRIAVAEVGLGSQDYPDAAALHLRDQIVKQIQMVVVQQIADAVGELIPQVKPEGVGSHARYMICVAVDGVFAVDALCSHCAVGMSEGECIVGAVIAHFLAVVVAAHAAVIVHIDAIAVGWVCSRAVGGGDACGA